MRADRITRRQRRSRLGLWMLAGLALAAGLLVIAVLLKSSAADQRARRELDRLPIASGEKSSTISPTGTEPRPLPFG